jgi:predicted regulator of Ras-like GTPase activity (Roadblock/LC7/MglB family)
LNLAAFDSMTLEADNAMIICTAIGDALLVVLSPDSIKLGMIRLRLKKEIADLTAMF